MAGGVVDIKTFDDYVLQYDSSSTNLIWNNGTNILTNATDTATGEFNTPLIVDVQGAGTYAASYCENATDYGYSDWYLPSIYELKDLYDAGMITSSTFWSSTEHSTNTAYVFDAATGVFYFINKSNTFKVLKFRKEYTTDVITIERMNLTSINAPILNGGVNNADEDVYKMLGGINGISKNSKIMINE